MPLEDKAWGEGRTSGRESRGISSGGEGWGGSDYKGNFPQVRPEFREELSGEEGRGSDSQVGKEGVGK